MLYVNKTIKHYAHNMYDAKNSMIKLLKIITCGSANVNYNTKPRKITENHIKSI